METRDFSIGEFITQIKKRNRTERCAIFIWGVLIYAVAFSIFFSPRNIVTGGSTGLSLIIYDIYGIDTSITVFVFSFVMLIIGYFTLGKNNAIKALFGVVLLPIFMEFSAIFKDLIGLENSSTFLIVFFGGALMGLGNGMILRSGFSCGGFQILYQILYKYFGISIGKSTLWINGILVFVGGFFFEFSTSLYAIIGLYISAVVAEKVMLESSVTKTFYIVTEKEKEISQYFVKNLGYGATVMNAKGGYSNDDKKIVMCAIPTRQYQQTKEVIQEIDNKVFFLIMDTYEIYGGM